MWTNHFGKQAVSYRLTFYYITCQFHSKIHKKTGNLCSHKVYPNVGRSIFITAKNWGKHQMSNNRWLANISIQQIQGGGMDSVNLKDVLLCKRSQTKISFPWNHSKDKTYLSDRKWFRGFLRERKGRTAKEHEGSFCCDRSVLFFLSFFLFTAAPVAYGSSWARGRTRAAAAGLCHDHSNAGSKLQLTPQLAATPDPDPNDWGWGLNPHPHRDYIGSLIHWTTVETPEMFYLAYSGDAFTGIFVKIHQIIYLKDVSYCLLITPQWIRFFFNIDMWVPVPQTIFNWCEICPGHQGFWNFPQGFQCLAKTGNPFSRG